jgi:hypothetical protein
MALTVSNNSNDSIIVRYLRADNMGRAELHLGPRDQKMIQDAYAGMTLFASIAFDPSTAYTRLKINADVDDCFFTDTSCGYGRGTPVGPPAADVDTQLADSRARATARGQAKKSAAVASEPVAIPGDAADAHGTSLAHAYSSDLTKTSGGGGAEIETATSGEQQQEKMWVPGMGMMPVSAIPPHIMKQLVARQAAQRDHGIQQDRKQAEPTFPNYDSQNAAAALDVSSP